MSSLPMFSSLLISIHAPRVGSDGIVHKTLTAAIAFQSTLPVWGATVPISGLSVGINISIHAPRVGSDHYC